MKTSYIYICRSCKICETYKETIYLHEKPQSSYKTRNWIENKILPAAVVLNFNSSIAWKIKNLSYD